MQNVLQKIKEFKEKIFKKEHLETAKNFDYRGFATTPSHTRTLAFLATVIIILALPVTVVVMQQRTNIFQHASGITCSSLHGHCMTTNLCSNSGLRYCGKLDCPSPYICGAPNAPQPTPTPRPPTPTPVPHYTCPHVSGSTWPVCRPSSICIGANGLKTYPGTCPIGQVCCQPIPPTPTPRPTATPTPVSCPSGSGPHCIPSGVCSTEGGQVAKVCGGGTVCCKFVPTPTPLPKITCATYTFKDGQKGTCVGVSNGKSCLNGNFYSGATTDCTPHQQVCCEDTNVITVKNSGIVCKQGSSTGTCFYNVGVGGSNTPDTAPHNIAVIIPPNMKSLYTTTIGNSDNSVCSNTSISGNALPPIIYVENRGLPVACLGTTTASTPTPTPSSKSCTSSTNKGICTASHNSCPSGYSRNSGLDSTCGSSGSNEICCTPNKPLPTPTPTPGSGGSGNGGGGSGGSGGGSGGGGNNPTPTPAPKSYGNCGGSGEGACLATATPGDGHSYSYQTQTAGSQCAINATRDNAPRGQTVYCCTRGSKQYGNCGNSGQYVCATSCSGSNISYQDKAADNQCAINGTKAGLARGTKMICSVPASSVGLSITLPAIGTGEFDNHSPKRTSRAFTVAVYAATADITKDKPLFTISHDSKYGSNGKFANPGHALDKHQLLDGDFQLTITTGGYLSTQLLNSSGGKTIHLTEGKATQAAPVTLTPGDFNADNVIDIKDYNAFIGCYGSKAGTSSCVVGKNTADLNDDGNVDGVDYNLWLRSYLATLQH